MNTANRPVSTVFDPETYACLRHEYSETALLFRHYSGLRFVILSLYVASVGGLGGVAVGIVGHGGSTGVVRLTAAAAFALTLMFLVFEMLCEHNIAHFKGVLHYLEQCLNYTTMSTKPSSPVVKATTALRVLYLSSVPTWIWLLIRGQM